MTFKHQTPENSTTWIVVADRAQARILARVKGEEGLHEVVALSHPESAMKQSDCVADYQGRGIGNNGAPVAFDSKTDWEHKNAAAFAKQVVDHLESGRNAQKFGKVELIAAPAFLGALRATLSAPLTAMVKLEVDKDYTDCSLEEIAKHLAKLTATKSA